MTKINIDEIKSLIKTNKELTTNLEITLSKIEQDKPKVELYEKIIDTSNLVSGSQLSKILNIKNIGRNKLYDILRALKIYMPKTTEPYQRYISSGYCEVKIKSCRHGDNEKVTLWTMKGIEYLIKLFKENGFLLNVDTKNI